jgi:hypothetical protein
MSTASVEVNECRVFATQRAADWWALYQYLHRDRIDVITPSIAGSLCTVKCDDRDHAEWLAKHMVDQGVPASAVQVRAA